MNPDGAPTTLLVIFKLPTFLVIELVTVDRFAVVAAVSLTIVTGLPLTDGVPNVQPVGADGSVGSDMAQDVPVSNGPIAELVAPAARLTVTSPAPQLYLIANVPANPDVFASNTLLILKYP